MTDLVPMVVVTVHLNERSNRVQNKLLRDGLNEPWAMRSVLVLSSFLVGERCKTHTLVE